MIPFQVHGQQEIHEKIMQLNFRDCKAKIRQVDAHATLASGVVVQVLGELSNNHQPMRRFMQTFVLAPQSPKKYYVYNDIFRYQDEVFTDLDLEANSNTSFDEADKYRGQTPSDGIATVSIIGKLNGNVSKNLVKSTKVTDLCIGFDEFFQISSKVQIFVLLYCDLTSYSNLVKSTK